MIKNKKFFIIFLLVILFIFNYSFLDSSLKKFLDDSVTTKVERVIDGDTVVVSDGEHIRLLGINTPEKGELHHDEAENFMIGLIQNKTVSLEFGKDKTDRYNRTLAYIFLDGENINQKQIENGFANFYFPQGKDVHYDSFKESWSKCIEENKNLCEKSDDKCSTCIELELFDYKGQILTFKNACDFSCDLSGWDIKDEGRKHFAFPKFVLNSNNEVNVIVGNKTNYGNNFFWKGQDYVWTKTGDTMFLRDAKGGLVLWKNY
jgi:micrococcal nuclease